MSLYVHFLLFIYTKILKSWWHHMDLDKICYNSFEKTKMA